MKLLLTSSGLSTEIIEKTFQNLLSKPAKENKALIMGVNPKTPNFDMQGYIDRNKQMLTKQGLTPENIKSFELDGENPPNLDDIDVLFMLGGTEYYYMYWIRKHGLYSEIRKFIDNDGVYVGRSAGAIIMGPDVDIEYWSTSSNDIGLENTSGFGYVDFITVPHIGSRENPEKVLEYHKETGHKMVYLTNQQAIQVLDDTYKII